MNNMNETVYNTHRLGLNVRRRRHVMRLTQVQLAGRVGCAAKTISAIERGRAKLSVNMLFSLGRALEWDVKELLMGVE